MSQVSRPVNSWPAAAKIDATNVAVARAAIARAARAFKNSAARSRATTCHVGRVTRALRRVAPMRVLVLRIVGALSFPAMAFLRGRIGGVGGAQKFGGFTAQRKLSPRVFPPAAHTAIEYSMFDDLRTTFAAVQNAERATETFAWRKVALIKLDALHNEATRAAFEVSRAENHLFN